MPMYHTCEYCNSNLDFGEKCDCQREESANIFMQLPEKAQDEVLKVMRKLVTSNKTATANNNC